MTSILRSTNHVVGQKFPQVQKSSQSDSKNLVNSFKDMFDEVNKMHVDADQKVEEMVAGRNKDIPGTMIAMEKADVSMRMLMTVRNKVVNAYEEIMRMQV